MKALKLAAGTLVGVFTASYLFQFIRVLIRADFSARGLIELLAALFCVCLGAVFTVWWFKNALGMLPPEASEEEVSVDMSLAPSPRVSWFWIALIPLTFWIPVVGVAVGWYGIRQARWVRMPDLIAFLLACLFYIGVACSLAAILAACFIAFEGL